MQRCLGCMREFGEEYEVCPYCGFIVGTKAAAKNHLAPGTVLQNRYTLGKVLGQGGFGITYVAWDNLIGRAVAIKEYMPNSFASRMTGETEVSCYNEEARRQFFAGLEKTRRETHALSQFAALESVVKVYDCIQENGTAYIIMELLRGRTVKEILAESGKLSFAQAMRIMTPILQTLDAMHSVGMIHRDVAPDNIFVCDDGTVKLLDFGAARVVSGTNNKTLSVMLKAGYAPIEQYSGRAQQGPYTDVYSASATMYKMLTGETPPDSLSRSDEDTLVPITTLASVPPAAVRAIEHGMTLHAQDRTQTASQLLLELQQQEPPKPSKPEPHLFAPIEPSLPEPEKKQFSGHVIRVAVGALVILAVILFAHFCNKSEEAENTDDASQTATEAVAAVTKSQSVTGEETIFFGRYEQDNDTSDGEEEIEWIVLEQQDDRALVVSKYALEALPYNDENSEETWETCSLRTWLNRKFLHTAFTDEELDRIQTVTVTADANPSFSTSPGNDTLDRVFLLSIEEASRYFEQNNRSKRCAPTAQAAANGAWASRSYTTTDGEAACWWWLRSPGSGFDNAASIDYFGSVDYYGHRLDHDDGGVRPAMWITL